MNLEVRYHLLLCATPTKASCCNPEQGLKSWARLKYIFTELNLDNPQRPGGIILRSKIDCLRICKEGPVLLIWPDGIWYKSVSPDRIEVIIRKHILEGTPIQEWIIKKTPLRNEAIFN